MASLRENKFMSRHCEGSLLCSGLGGEVRFVKNHLRLCTETQEKKGILSLAGYLLSFRIFRPQLKVMVRGILEKLSEGGCGTQTLRSVTVLIWQLQKVGCLLEGSVGGSLCENIDGMSESNLLGFFKILSWAVLCSHCNNKNYKNGNFKILEHYGVNEIWKNENSR